MPNPPKKPFITPWDGDAVQRLDEDRQWSELSKLVDEGIIGEDSCSKVASLWLRRKVKEAR